MRVRVLVFVEKHGKSFLRVTGDSGYFLLIFPLLRKIILLLSPSATPLHPLEVNGAVGGGIDETEKKTLVQGKAEALEKCLEENKGDNTKCKAKVEAFRSSSSPKKPLKSLRLRSGLLTDV
ncbi:hypothetical protein QQP08_003093 [Theobroma cacao]|nr:hypothetical protein QQP08_003093 [Theobroma cacao]